MWCPPSGGVIHCRRDREVPQARRRHAVGTASRLSAREPESCGRCGRKFNCSLVRGTPSSRSLLQFAAPSSAASHQTAWGGHRPSGHRLGGQGVDRCGMTPKRDSGFLRRRKNVPSEAGFRCAHSTSTGPAKRSSTGAVVNKPSCDSAQLRGHGPQVPQSYQRVATTWLWKINSAICSTEFPLVEIIPLYWLTVKFLYRGRRSGLCLRVACVLRDYPATYLS